ncbi:dihydrolipoyl dehydrogenase [Eubacteriales bacterium SGI.150]|uniref:dihydrolipoyl dehydrogenase n=1 Tax=Intestinimonas TaxID=1392389 RepID=UPI00242B71CD|nr:MULTISPECIES: dihydrolipoyl dehydrogenase [Intestinimonas]MCI5562775.1 dihydrolipoyl dehydrogenase [Intestinimonas massiliensis (ex Afouda et al. 2020)]MDY5338046.1 dihydrolipoyl dehydrogenase [Intestinimonas sp.]
MKVVVLGGGPGGYVAAIRAAMLGGEVTVVEKGSMGGTCLNVGCIPTKAMLASSGVLDTALEAGKFGVTISGEIGLDFPAVMARKDKVVEQLVQGIEMLFAARGVSVLRGTGTVMPGGSISVALNDGGEETLCPDKIILATGSLPVVPAMFPYDGEKIITSDEALYLEQAPKSLIIVGGGVIGCELGQFFAKAGTAVSIVEAMPHILPSEDKDVASALARSFRKNKINVSTGQKVVRCQIVDGAVQVELENGKIMEAEKLLVCIGRKPNTAFLPLDELGIEHKNGKILVDEHMQTACPNIYAIGDIVDSAMLAHVASQEGLVAVEHMFGKDRSISYRGVPRCVYTTPEVAGVGMTEQQLQAKGIAYRAGVFHFMGLGKAKAAGKTDGFVKVLADENDVIVGGCVVGEHATELLAELTLAVELQLTAEQVGRVIHPHPTMCEALMEALHQIHGACVHAL